jgi:hypothetical protein
MKIVSRHYVSSVGIAIEATCIDAFGQRHAFAQELTWAEWDAMSPAMRRLTVRAVRRQLQLDTELAPRAWHTWPTALASSPWRNHASSHPQ